MGTYAWNILFSKILPAKSRARHRRPAAQAAPSQAVHRNLATGPNNAPPTLQIFEIILSIPSIPQWILHGHKCLEYTDTCINSLIYFAIYSIIRLKLVTDNLFFSSRFVCCIERPWTVNHMLNLHAFTINKLWPTHNHFRTLPCKFPGFLQDQHTLTKL